MAKKQSPIKASDVIISQETHNTPVVKAIPKLSQLVNTPIEIVEDNGFRVPHGYYHMYKVDKNGVEIPNTDVSISPAAYKRTFSKLENYRVKKNPQ